MIPIGRILAQVIVPVIAVVARALPAAYRQALQNARKSGQHAAQDSAAGGMNVFGTKRMSRSEALQILNFTETKATVEAIEKQYEKYFAANAVERGGSFYLQSKVYRAKELLDEYVKEAHEENKKAQEDAGRQQQQQQDDDDNKDDRRGSA